MDRNCWWKKPITGWAESSTATPKTPDAFHAAAALAAFAYPSHIAITITGMCSGAAPCSNAKLSDFNNIRLNAVVQLRNSTGAGSLRTRSSSRRSAIYASIASSVNTPPAFQRLAVEVQRVRFFPERTRYLWDLFSLLQRQVIRVFCPWLRLGESYS